VLISAVAVALGVTAAGVASSHGSTAGAAKLKVVLIENQQPGDKGSIDEHIDGMNRGAKAFGWDTPKNVYVSDPGQYEPTLRKFAQAGYDLIITTFPPTTKATINVAKEFPKVRFVNSNGEFVPASTIPSNMQEYFGKDAEGTFLAGALAAMMSKTGTIAFMTGPVVDVDLRWESGVLQGALHVNPKIKFRDAFADSYSDPANGKDLALRLYKSGVDVIATAAAGTDLGIHQAAETDPSKYHTVSLDTLDIKAVAPHAGLAAIACRYDNWVYKMMSDVTHNKFKGGVSYLGLNEGGWSIVQWGSSVPAKYRAKIDALRKQIASGQVKVVATFPQDKQLLAKLKKKLGA
jgi:basic membrane protein A